MKKRALFILAAWLGLVVMGTLVCVLKDIEKVMVEDALVDMEYEDYIFTYSHRLRTVFVWVRGKEEDVIITYPTRPDLLGLEVGGVYHPEKVKMILSASLGK